MIARFAGAVLMGVLALGPAAIASAQEGGAPGKLPIVVSGRAVPLQVVARDASGMPLSDTLVRLIVRTRFMGADQNVTVDENRTDRDGVAQLVFAWAERGLIEASVVSISAYGMVDQQSVLAFDVREPVPGYRRVSPGLKAPWTHAGLIVVPVAGVWIAYVVAIRQVAGIRRAGPAPRARSLSADSSGGW